MQQCVIRFALQWVFFFLLSYICIYRNDSRWFQRDSVSVAAHLITSRSHSHMHGNSGLFIPRVGKVPWSDMAYLVRLKGRSGSCPERRRRDCEGISTLLSRELLIRIVQLHGLLVHTHTNTHLHFVYLWTAALPGMDAWIEPTRYNAYTYIYNLIFEVVFVWGMHNLG